jgi:hypothetical protein
MSDLPAHEHADVVRLVELLADSAEQARAGLVQLGAVQEPPCETCLIASAGLQQIVTCLWLLRWTSFSREPPTSATTLNGGAPDWA